MYTNEGNDYPILTLWWAGDRWATNESCEINEYTIEQAVALHEMGLIPEDWVGRVALRDVRNARSAVAS